jgi:hypothetical protein
MIIHKFRFAALYVLLFSAFGIFSPVHASIYSTDFETMSIGTVNGQDEWRVGYSTDSLDGEILDDGTGNKVLQITGNPDWGMEVGRDLPTLPTKQFLRVAMNFNRQDDGGFWFMDNLVPDLGVDSIFWNDHAFSNANPGSNYWFTSINSWYQAGIEIDQFSREITAYLFDGTWQAEDDSAGMATPGFITNFYFRGVGDGGDGSVSIWIDDLSISEHDFSILTPLISCEGFDHPMATPPVKARKNRVFPLKMELFDGNGLELTDGDLAAPPIVQVLHSPAIGDPGVDVSDDALASGVGTEGNEFIFTKEGIWQFNLKSTSYSAPGEYMVIAVSGDESEYIISPACVTSFIVD